MEVSHGLPPTPGSVPSGDIPSIALLTSYDPVLEPVRMVVSELLGASTRHAGRRGAKRIGMRIQITEDPARVEVSDLPLPQLRPAT